LAVTENPSNAYRVYAWVTAIEKIASSPLVGVGFPNEAAIQEAGVSFESLDENLIAESWYLSSAITFGIPYTLLYLGSLLIAFYGKAFSRRNRARAMLYPYVVVDLIYGSFFGSVLIYSWLWLLICSVQERSRGAAPLRTRQAVLQPRAAPAVESAIHPHDAAAPHRG
jgi:O-antigen ligase